MFLPDDPAEPLSLRYLLAFVAAGHGMNEAELEEALYRAGCGSLRLALSGFFWRSRAKFGPLRLRYAGGLNSSLMVAGRHICGCAIRCVMVAWSVLCCCPA